MTVSLALVALIVARRNCHRCSTARDPGRRRFPRLLVDVIVDSCLLLQMFNTTERITIVHVQEEPELIGSCDRFENDMQVDFIEYNLPHAT